MLVVIGTLSLLFMAFASKDLPNSWQKSNKLSVTEEGLNLDSSEGA